MNENNTSSENIAQARLSCPYGDDCYRANPSHRSEVAHPGDEHYTAPRMPSPVAGAPKCRYWRQCYRTNYDHFRNFRHPRRNAYTITNNPTGIDSFDETDSEEEEDPFAESSGSDYLPSDEDE
uniref:PBZ-type domain-containing protein n=1 Tax=Stomoxys calcitrans TaxID=35570 RepID=A0A1I8P8B3_STOCA